MGLITTDMGRATPFPGIPVIPKTHRADYMLENVDLFDWELTADEMTRLTSATSPQTGPTSGDCDVL